MSKMSELNRLVQELKKCGESLVNIADELAEIFLRQGKRRQKLPQSRQRNIPLLR